MYLWDAVDRPDVLHGLPLKPKMDDVKYVHGALVWRVDRDAVTRSGLAKLVGSPLYTQMTIRNSNTARKLLELMEDAANAKE